MLASVGERPIQLRQVGEVAAIGLDGARREARGGDGEEALDGRIGSLLRGHAG